MKIKELEKRTGIEKHKKLINRYSLFEKFISELNKKEIPSEIVILINKDIEEINLYSGSNNSLLKLFRKSKMNILKLIEEELIFVPKNLFRLRWMVLGMTIIGVPIGVVIGVTSGNMAFLGIGIGVGMVVGMAIGTGMDKKAFDEGRQLDIEIKL